MSGTMTITTGGNSITVDMPQYGYTVDVFLSIIPAMSAAGTLTAWDNGIAYDHRVLRGLKWLLNAADQAELQDFFTTVGKGRETSVVFGLGGTPTGFFPFGADKGDKGNFSCRMIEQSQGGMNISTWRHYENTLKFVLVTPPSYSLPTQVDEGDFQIGSVDGIRYPQGGFELDAQKNVSHVLTHSGVPYEMDGANSADVFYNSFTVETNQTKMAALMAYLTATARGGEFQTIFPSDSYPFGIEQSAGGAMNVRLNQTTLSMTHNNFDSFSLPLKLWFKEVVLS